MAYRRGRRGRSGRSGYRSGYSSRGRRRTSSYQARGRRRRSYGGRTRSGIQRLRIEIAQPPAMATGITPEALAAVLGKVPRTPRVAKF